MKAKNARDLVNIALTAAQALPNRDVQWVLSQLKKVSDVEFSTKIDTACVRKIGEIYRIEFSQDFVRKWLDDPEDILFVLLHEIFHKIRGDLLTRLGGMGPAEALIANIVEDIQINSMLLKEYFPRGVGLVERLYDVKSLPEVLLAPPPLVIRTHAMMNDCPDLAQIDSMEDLPALQPKILHTVMELVMRGCGIEDEDKAEKLASWYLDAWIGDCTVRGLVERLMEIMELEDADVLLLGDHEGPGCKLPDFIEALDDPAYRFFAGSGEDLEEDDIEPSAPARKVTWLHREIRNALAPDPKNPRDAMAFMPERTVVPGFGRRDCYMLACDAWPYFFTNNVYQQTKDDHRVHLYIDVSGSTNEIQSFLYGLVLHLGDLTGEPLYLFSNKVVEVSLKNLEEGSRKTTWGTDFDCVVEHALQNRFRKVLMITDGFASLSDEHAGRVLKGDLELYVLLTECEAQRDLEPVAKKIWFLNLDELGYKWNPIPRSRRRKPRRRKRRP
ncbi:MAG: hypothetical protein ABIJ56_16390 [Pseudomonadota bacterium]